MTYSLSMAHVVDWHDGNRKSEYCANSSGKEWKEAAL